MSAGSPLLPSDPISSALQSIQSQGQTLANSAMAAGATFLQKQRYDLALKAFQQAVAFAPDSADALTLLGKTYVYLGRNADAIAAYQRATRADPTYTDAAMQLGTLQMQSQKYPEAEKAFKQVLQYDPTNASAMSSLGFVYLQSGRLTDAASQFEKVARVSPRDAGSHYGLGQVLARQGDTNQAIAEYQKAIQIDRKYAAAYSELGFTYIAQGQPDKALEQADALVGINTSESLGMATRIQVAVNTPKIEYMDPTRSTFNVTGAPGTAVSTLAPGLATPGGSATLAVSFVFNQPMDLTSVTNVFNWTITRASGGEGGVYDNGVVLHPGKEATVMPYPMTVNYDSSTHTATVYFRITQNATGDAVIDPSHLVFQFNGTSAAGDKIDPAGDQFDGFSMLRF